MTTGDPLIASGAGAATLDGTARPARVPAVEEYQLGDELLVYVPASETAHALNRSAAAIWELCDGTRTVEEICRDIGESLDRPAEALLPDVRAGIARLSELGLVDRGHSS